MLPAIVLVAEGLVVLWFLLFLTMITSTYLDGKNYGTAIRTRVEQAFLKHIRNFVVLGITTACLFTLAEAFELV
ncbi:hypothetical protein [Pseudovibrio sp. JE062]|uniref:hypothetical protein n=1 Tax=Pseudovibrio sp. JE062 TaxID=439495 RepID=UPI000186C1C8|nr:hypothetical protein [Pseudovibrio sp. JE062]EEA94712.1 hypothetical protein PJE062_700 [Pseudovibrio sp. JE062]